MLSGGGDEGDLVVLPVANPSKRMGKLDAGEVGMYNEHGDKAVLTAGGDLNVSRPGRPSMSRRSRVLPLRPKRALRLRPRLAS